MAGTSTIKKILAFALILAFSQKMGMGLHLHNWLHANDRHSAAAAPLSSEELKNACSCINDFTAPLTETTILELPPPQTLFNSPVAAYTYTLPAVYKYFHSLRAPPAPLS
jgi:hypothetical protein